MDFEVSDDRRMLSDTLTRWLASDYPIDHRNKVAYTEPYHDPQKWAELAELGALMALADEAHGGFGGRGYDVMTVFDALGRGLCPEPVLPALMAVRVLSAAGEDLEALVSGATRYAVGIGELAAPYTLDGIETEATPSGDEWRVTGRKSVVYGGIGADRILVAAKHGGTLGVYEVDGTRARITGFGMIDGGPAAEVFLEGTPARQVMGDGTAALQDALDWGALALCAEAVGAMDVTKDTLLDYLKQRKQFGKRIGDFQVLQHRTVDLAIEIEQARSITILAASRMGEVDQSRTASMAKNLIGRAARLVSEETIQMHGGIAMTWEYPVSHYAKRLVMLDGQLGDTDYHLERVMAEHMAA
ncbi:acyl-CoA dehydrogenase family protein [Acuticoccus sp.]|uniref:acyl-CoA dehydrogenase family protein n=1 Tax=Acuticoccus sp. TaxID=1904378 RepID=UPI003B51A33D